MAQGDLDLGKPDAAPSDAVVVADYLCRVTVEGDPRLDGWGCAVGHPGLEMMQGCIDHRRHGDLIDGLHGLVQRNGEAEVPLHTRR
jgi:hypothetical protein